ncbi:MAG: hypothetical protein ACP5NY_02995 [Thermocladium sp.]
MNPVEAALLAMLSIHDGSGRYYLAKLSGLGEGFIRDRLKNLREQGLIVTKRSGNYLTEKGMEELNEYLNSLGIARLSSIDLSPIFKDKYLSCLIAVTKRGIDDVVRARDELIRHGCKAAIIMHNECSEIAIPMTPFKLRDLNNELNQRLKNISSCGDTLIGVCGDNEFINVMAILSTSG